MTLTAKYLSQAESDAKKWAKFRGTPLATLGNHCCRLVAEVRRLQAPPAPTQPPLVDRINRETAAMLAGGLPVCDRDIYASQDPYTPAFVRNPTCWLAGVSNLTCISPAQLSGAAWNQRAGTLITRRHVVYAAHFGVPVIDGGTPILFVARDGTVVTRRVVAEARDDTSDIAIGLLDDEVPPGIEVAPVLPEDFGRHFGLDATGYMRLPFLAVSLDQQARANVIQCNSLFAGRFSTNTLHENYVAPEFKRLAAWSEATVVGDSGNPTFAIIGGELVLLGCWHTPIGGPHLGARHELVAGMLERLSPGQGYRVTVKNL